MKKGISTFASFTLVLLALVSGLSTRVIAASEVDCDLFSDGHIDWRDLDAFVEKWLFDCLIYDCGGANLADDNNSVDLADFAWFAEHWSKSFDVNLVGWWEFDEGVGDIAYDSIGDNDMSLYGPPSWIAGRVGTGALYFGSGDYGQIPAGSSLEPAYITVSLWTRPRSGRCMISNFQAEDDGAFLLQLDASEDLQSAVCIGDALQAGTPISITKEWQHVAMTYDGDRLRTYLDGRLKANDDVADGVLPADGNRIYIANREDLAMAYSGAIDDVRIYNRVLSGLDIASFVGLEGQALGPSPADGADDTGAEVVLSWSPGAYAALHDVYFSTSFDDVNDANSSWPAGGPGDAQVYKGRQEPNSYDPGGLETGLDYYWRIDEVNDVNIWRGDVWSFRTVEGPASDFFAVPRSGWDIYYKAEFVSVSTGKITEYLWDFGDGTTSTESAPNHQYSSAGTYTVSLTVTGPVGADTITKTNYITVKDFVTEYNYPDYILNEPTQAVYDAAMNAIDSGGGGRILFNFSNQTINVDHHRDFFGNNLIVDGQDKNVSFFYTGPDDCSQTEGQDALLRIHGNDNIFRNVNFDRFPEGVHLRGGNRNLIENCTVTTICEDAMSMNGGDYECYDCIIRDCSYGSSADKAVMVNSGGLGVFRNLNFTNSRQPIRCTGGSGYYVIRHCDFDGAWATSTGPRFSGGHTVYFEKNYVHNSQYGIRVYNSVEAIIRHNTFTTGDDYGVFVYDTAKVRLEHNSVESFDKGGVFIDEQAQADLGGGSVNIDGSSTSSPGGNSLKGNSSYDLRNNTSSTIKAEYNYWDHSTVQDVLANDVDGSVDVDPLGVP